MSWPPTTRGIWLSIVFALLWVDSSRASETTTEEPRPPEGSQENYDVIDMAEHQQASGDYGAKAVTGQTTRFFTTGEVDDDFWLKHLGEDYKNAVHLVVGGKEENYGDFNSTELDGAFEEEEEDQQQHQLQSEQLNANPVEHEQQGSRTTEPEPGQDGRNATAKAADETTAGPGPGPKRDQSYEQVFAIDDSDMRLANQFFKPNSFHVHNKKYTHYTETAHKYTPAKYTRHNGKRSDPLSGAGGGDNKDPRSSYVVNLPEFYQNVYQLNANEQPVVVKMPPVIYHRNPAYTYNDDRTHTHTHTHTHNDDPAHSHSHAHSHKHSHKHSHSHGHNTHSTHHHRQQHGDTQSSSMQRDSSYHSQQQQQQQKPYSGFKENYYGRSVGEDHGQQPSSSGSDQKQAPATNDADPPRGLRFIGGSAAKSVKSGPSYGDSSPTENSYDGYSRVGRSNRAIFEEGL